MQECQKALLDRGINPASSIEYEINSKTYTLTLEWIIKAYLQTEKKDLFIELFKKTLEGKDSDIEKFFQQMGQLVLMSSLSEKELQKEL